MGKLEEDLGKLHNVHKTITIAITITTITSKTSGLEHGWGARGRSWETKSWHLGRTLFPRLSPMSPKATIEVPAFFINRAIKGSLYVYMKKAPFSVETQFSPGPHLPVVAPVHVFEIPDRVSHLPGNLRQIIVTICLPFQINF